MDSRNIKVDSDLHLPPFEKPRRIGLAGTALLAVCGLLLTLLFFAFLY